MITEPAFLKYDNLQDDDKYTEGMDDTTVYQAAITDENISELISLRQNTVRSNASKPVSVLSKMLTRGDTKVP